MTDSAGSRLAGVDLSHMLSKKDEARLVAAGQRRMLQLRLVNAGLLGSHRLGPALCVVFEGWDAAGKGGSIRRLCSPLDPRHVRVAEFGAPTPEELRHHFLWRFFPALPGRGGMSVFDRSWYGRVLVERVEKLATADQWQRAYDEIVQFERALVVEGTVLVKLWLHISDKEQLRRFEARQANPLKAWKLTDEDWRNRKKRRQYEAAVEEMLARTDHDAAPWHVIPAEQKRYGRVEVLRTVIARTEEGMRLRGIDLPPSAGPELEIPPPPGGLG